MMATSKITLLDTLEDLRCAVENLETSPEQRRVRSAYNRVVRKTNAVVKKSFYLTSTIGPSCGPLPTPFRPL